MKKLSKDFKCFFPIKINLSSNSIVSHEFWDLFSFTWDCLSLQKWYFPKRWTTEAGTVVQLIRQQPPVTPASQTPHPTCATAGSFLKCTEKQGGNGPGTWVPATCVRDLSRVSGSQVHSGLAMAARGEKQQTQYSLSPHPLCHSRI